MTYETVVPELFERFPDLRSSYESKLHYMLDEPPLPYVVFGSVLIPYLEAALHRGDLRLIVTLCAFLEDAADASRNDISLETLLKVEIGEWLGGVKNEERLSPWLGPETKRICGYVPGLSTQRAELEEKRRRQGLKYRVSSSISKLFGR